MFIRNWNEGDTIAKIVETLTFFFYIKNINNVVSTWPVIYYFILNTKFQIEQLISTYLNVMSVVNF
jgi:hypothetical protein